MLKLEVEKLGESGIYLLLAILSLSLYILSKQLAIFSFPLFFLLSLITVWKFWHSFRYRGIFLLFLALILFVFSFRYIDSLFEISQKFYDSSYLYVLARG